jgi:hypothetical protein
LPTDDYTRPFRYHAVPERTNRLRLGTPLNKWLSADAGTVTADTLVATTATLTNPTVSGTLAVTGTTAFTGAQTGTRRAMSVTSADTIAIAAADSGTVYVSTKASATQVFTLPTAATAGLQYTFVCGNAGTEIHVGVTGAETIATKTHGANDATGIITTATTGLLKNTAASNVVGDFITLVSDGVSRWYGVSIAGVWSAT